MLYLYPKVDNQLLHKKQNGYEFKYADDGRPSSQESSWGVDCPFRFGLPAWSFGSLDSDGGGYHLANPGDLPRHQDVDEVQVQPVRD